MKRPLFALFVLLAFVSIAYAQDSTPIEYGEVVTGEITNQSYEVNYTFTGKAGEIVIAEMAPVDTLGDLNSPQVLILDSDFEVIGDSSQIFNFGVATVMLELPDDGEYNIIATRTDGRSGDSLGEYTLELILPQILADGDETTGSVSSEGRNQYFAVQLEADGVLQYAKTDGDMFPQITVKILGTSTEVFTLSGEALDYAIAGTLAANTTYVVEVGEALFDFNFTEVTADFTLSTANTK